MHPNIDGFLRDETLERALRLELGDGLYNELHALAMRDIGPLAETGRPKVFILPNFMGSVLTRPRFPFDDVLWVDVGELILGGAARLVPGDANEPVEATDALWFAYARLRARLRQAHIETEFLPYDWRLSPVDSGTQLMEMLRRRSVGNAVLIAHGMGGLVARRMAELDPGGQTVGKVITLGAPNYGSYAPVEMLRLTHPAVQRLGAIDRIHTPAELARDVLRHLAGLLELMPVPGRGAHDFFAPSAWPSGAATPLEPLLTEAGQRRATLAGVDERFTQIIGIGRSTRVDAEVDNAEIVYTDSLDGDGTVPRELAEMGDVARYYVEADHASLCNRVAVIDACISLIQNGTAALPQRPALANAAETDVSERELYVRARAAAAAMPPAPLAKDDLLDGFVSGAASPDPEIAGHASHGDASKSAPPPSFLSAQWGYRAPSGEPRTPPSATSGDPDAAPDAIDSLLSIAYASTDIFQVVRDAQHDGHCSATPDDPSERPLDPAIVAAWKAIDTLLHKIREPDDASLIEARRDYSTDAHMGHVAGISEPFSGNDFFMLARGVAAGRAVARLRLPHGALGTGFLVGPNLLLTNHHVLSHRSLARSAWASFCYELADGGLPLTPLHFRLTDEVFLTSEALDYTFVSVEPVNGDGNALAEFGSLPLLPRSGKALKREYLNIIEHPGGLYKKVILRENLALGRDGPFLYYTSNTPGGSSGAPVMNAEWQVAALHNMAVPHPERRWQPIANRGVRISSILEDLDRSRDAQDPDAIAVEIAVRQGRDRPLDGPALLPLPHPHPGPERSAPPSTIAVPPTENEQAHVSDNMFEFEDHRPHAQNWTGEQARSVLSDRGFAELVGHEIGSIAYYTNVLNEAPTWHAGQSGVTIGVGYDLGDHTLSEFAADWREHLSASDYNRLAQAVGLKGEAARRKAGELADIKIPLAAASTVFEAATLPKHVAALYRSLPQETLDSLHPHCISALVSLVSDRGATFLSPNERDREMRNIISHLERQYYDAVPAELRSMKRLWSPVVQGGRLRRREHEAKLFEAGLHVMHAATNSSTSDGDADEWLERIDELGDVVSAASRAIVPEALGPAYWPTNHRNAPDTWHLPGATKDIPFTLTADVIDHAIALGAFAPDTADHGKIILGLRGCALADGGDSVEDVGAVDLVPVTPTHVDLRCLLGVFDTHSRTLALYLASTVPAQRNMRSYALGGHRCNMLPTGCHPYCVGTHYGAHGAITYVLRHGSGSEPESAARATVMRTTHELAYGTRDAWDNTRPADNIHPAFSSDTFISAGCLTVSGTQQGDSSWSTGTGLWSAFREHAGFNGQRWGERFDLLLLTGHELSTVAQSPSAHRFACLRQGSQGAVVRTLQSQLGIVADGNFGAVTAHALASRQIEILGFATATWTPAMADTLGLVFAH